MINKILVPVDGSKIALRALEFAMGRSAVLQQIPERPACLCRAGEP